MLDKNDKNKFKPQNVYGYVEITLVQHTLLENEYPDRGRKPYLSLFLVFLSGLPLENEYPDRGRKLFVIVFIVFLLLIRKRIPR